ncbi:hypothetical protein Rs2_15999 [Raphanus sativus]|nr:hypothetical protein Rs2_15999 [Raphanus sativus]
MEGLGSVRCSAVNLGSMGRCSTGRVVTQSLLEQALSDPVPDQGRIKEIQEALTIAYAEEEAYWRQRSRIQWLHEGDKTPVSFTRLLEEEEPEIKFRSLKTKMVKLSTRKNRL